MTNVIDKSIEDTGERMVPAYHKTHTVYGEHIVRYEAAVSLVEGKVVLDIASGSGYGSGLLGKKAKKVYGVDLDKDAIRYANKNYATNNVSFLEGNGVSIPIADKAVDVVVSFETIEHIENYEAFMREIKRVLKDDGLLILSTPNEDEFPETNHFHIHEFKKEELEGLVKKYFKNMSSYYQGTWFYNALLDEKDLKTEWTSSIETLQTAPIDTNKSIYFYMLCSDRPITEKVKPISAIAEHYSERGRQEYEASIRKHMKDQATIIEHQKRAIVDSEERAKSLENQIKEINKKLNKIRRILPVKLLRKFVR